MTENTPGISRPQWLISCIISLLVGVGATALYYTPAPPPHEEGQEAWIPFSITPEPLTYAPEASRADIKLPPVTSFSGKAKFVADPASRATKVKLGYITDIAIAPLDEKQLPPQYKAAADAKDKSASLHTVDYDVVFYFILKDKDGFPLMKVASNVETVQSGENNHFQFFSKTYIPQAVAASTRAISARVEAVRCLSCRQERHAEEQHRSHSLFHF